MVAAGRDEPGHSMSAMSQIMDATYCIGGDMDFGRMFDQYLHKVSSAGERAALDGRVIRSGRNLIRWSAVRVSGGGGGPGREGRRGGARTEKRTRNTSYLTVFEVILVTC